MELFGMYVDLAVVLHFNIHLYPTSQALPKKKHPNVQLFLIPRIDKTILLSFLPQENQAQKAAHCDVLCGTVELLHSFAQNVKNNWTIDSESRRYLKKISFDAIFPTSSPPEDPPPSLKCTYLPLYQFYKKKFQADVFS